jgi:hypothetical protein
MTDLPGKLLSAGKCVSWRWFLAWSLSPRMTPFGRGVTRGGEENEEKKKYH